MLLNKEKTAELFSRLKLALNDDDKILKYIIVSVHNNLFSDSFIKNVNPKIVSKYYLNYEIHESLDNEVKSLLNQVSLEDKRDLIRYAFDNYNGTIRGINHVATRQLSELAINLLKIGDSGEDVLYNPNCGIGYPLISVLDSIKRNDGQIKEIKCDDINDMYLYFQNLISDIFGGQKINVNIKKGGLLSDLENEEYNKILVMGPLSFTETYHADQIETWTINSPFRRIKNSEWYFLDKMIRKNTKNFRGFILTLGKTLWERSKYDFREKLIENGYLEGIIQLPERTLPFTNMNAFILILSSGNEEVKFLDASEIIIKNKSRFGAKERLVNLDIGTITDRYFNNSFKLKASDLKKLKNLTPSIVSTRKFEIENPIPLKDVANVFLGNQYTIKNFEPMIEENETGYSILTSNDIDDYTILVDNLKHIKYESNKFDKYAIQYGDLVVTSKSSKVKVGVIDFNPTEKIIVTGGMIIVRPDLTKINPIYLKVFLDSDPGRSALKMIQKGSAIVSIGSNDLAEVMIPLIDKSKQDLIANKFNNKVTNLIAFKKEIEQIEKSIKSLFNEEMED